MTPSIDSSAPPGYSSQRDETSPLQSIVASNGSTEDLVSAQSHPQSSPSSAQDGSTPRSDAHFPASHIHILPPQPIQRTSTGTVTMVDRRRYSSLPYGSSSVTFPVHLQYQCHQENDQIHPPDPSNSTDTAAASDCPPASPHLQEKMVKMRPHSHIFPSLHSRSSNVKLNPTNYVSLSRKSTPHRRFLSPYRTSASIKGTFSINPHLHIPAALLAPLPAHASTRGDPSPAPMPTRKNLTFEVENGGIDVAIYLVGDRSSSDEEAEGEMTTQLALRTTLDLKIRAGEGDIRNRKNTFPLVTKIHTPVHPRLPFHLLATGLDGYHALHLPASFHGLITITVSSAHPSLGAHISLSTGLMGNATILNESAVARSYFVGELSGWGRGVQAWEGDRVDVRVRKGLVRMQMIGESAVGGGWRRICWNIGF